MDLQRDGRQAVFVVRRYEADVHHATFIDKGYCFNAGEWTFPDYPLRGVFANNCVYEGVTGWDAFEPALTRAEEMDSDIIWRCAVDIPEEWYEGDRDGLHRLVETLYTRRGVIRKLVNGFREVEQSSVSKLGGIRRPPLIPVSRRVARLFNLGKGLSKGIELVRFRCNDLSVGSGRTNWFDANRLRVREIQALKT